MAKSAVQLEGEEIRYFHANYSYMWKKLNTAPYYVNGSGQTPPWIKEPWLLPSYVNLSRCMNPTYVPSVNLVNKIVQFYNANIEPEIDSYAFLHQDLSTGDSLRSAHSFSDVTPYCGLYYLFYFAGIADKREVYGGLMSIRSLNASTVLQLVTGITTDEDLRDPKLRSLVQSNDISL